VAENAVERVRYDAGNWDIRVRILKGGQGVLPIDLTIRVTLIVYRVTSAGAFVAEIGRVQMADSGISTSTIALSGSFTTGGTTTVNAGDKVHVEAYIQVIAVGGSPIAPAAAVTFTFVVDETSGAGGAAFQVIPGYQILYARALSFVGVGVPTASRVLVGVKRNVAAATHGAASVSKRVTKSVSTVGVAVAVLVRKVGLPRSYAAVGAVTLPRKVVKALTMSGIGAASADRRVVAFRPVAAAGIGAASTARAIIARRVFAAASIGLANLDRRLLMRRVVDASAVGLVTVPRKVTKLVSATAIGAASLAQRYFKVVTFTAIGAAAVQRALVLRRTLEASARGALRIFAKLPIERIPRRRRRAHHHRDPQDFPHLWRLGPRLAVGGGGTIRAMSDPKSTQKNQRGDGTPDQPRVQKESVTITQETIERFDDETIADTTSGMVADNQESKKSADKK